MSATDNGKKKPNRAKVTVRPTTEEHEHLEKNRKAYGYKSLSKYLIERGLREPVMLTSNIDPERFERLLFEVRKIGVNINQIALQMNRGYTEYSQAHLNKAFQEVERVMQSIGEEIENR